ncbi:MAG: ribonuclease H-like domain-containing protein [Bacillota bacterium]
MQVSAVRLEDGEEWHLPGGGAVWRCEQIVPPGRASGLPQAEAGPVGRPWHREEAWLARTRLVRGIGPVRERRLREQGFGDLVTLQHHPVWGAEAARAWQSLVERRIDELRRRRVPDGDMLSLFGAGELLFLDVETMGLAPVFPLFLAGFARWEAGTWRFTLLLARSFEEEPVLLRAIELAVGSAAAVVTYNGRAFDMPFVNMRRVYHGAAYGDGWPPVHVLDLLSEARRRFRAVLPDARLESVDRFLTGGARPPSIPSCLVPEYYRRFVETRERAWIEPVLQHNLLDLKALVRLWGAVAGAAQQLAPAG